MQPGKVGTLAGPPRARLNFFTISLFLLWIIATDIKPSVSRIRCDPYSLCGLKAKGENNMPFQPLEAHPPPDKARFRVEPLFNFGR